MTHNRRLDETVQLCRRLGADTKGVTFDVTDEAAVTAVVEELGPQAKFAGRAALKALK